MDFHSLARKDLQALCKKNKIPANITNVAMADALKYLPQVEGLEEILNQFKSEVRQSPEKNMNESVENPRTACRTLTRRKSTKEEPQSFQPLTRTRGRTRQKVVEGDDQDKSDTTKTPAATSRRRVAPAASDRQQKRETAKEQTSVKRAYSTRRSVRLLGKNLAKMSLLEDEEKTETLKMDDLSTEMVNSSEITECSLEIDSVMQTSSEVCSEKAEDLEISSELKSNGSLEVQSEFHDDGKEKSESNMIGVQDLKSGSENYDVNRDSDMVLETPEETTVESDHHFVENSNETDNDCVQVPEFSSETEKSNLELDSGKINDLKAGQDVVTEFSLAAKISHNLSDKVYVQVVPLTLCSSQGQPNALGDASQTHSGNVLEMNVNAMEGLDNGKPDYALEHSAEMKHDKVKNLAYVDESSKPGTFTRCLNGSQNHIGSFPSDMTKDDYDGKFDFESEGISEDGSVNNTSEKESVGIEHSGDDISEEDSDYETDEITEEDNTSEEEFGDDEVEEESDLSEPELSVLSDSKQDSDQLPSDEKSLVDDFHIDQAKEVAIANQSHSVPVSPCPVVSGSEVASEISFRPFATDDKEECIETSNVAVDKGDLKNLSMRELKKLLKNMQIENKKNKDKKQVENKRTALQEVKENCMAVRETEKKN